MQYACPNCDTPLVWDNNNAFRPFCSEQCKNKDLIAWANEDNRIPGNAQFDDLFSEDNLT